MADASEQPEVHEFKPNFLLAFCTLLLYKHGGEEAISEDCLEQFDPDSGPDVWYDADKKAWVMKLKPGDMPIKILVPKKILKKMKMSQGSLS